jgi:pyruvate dehydrogenase E2 component (dihydrolipoamide acetyltransferase)
VTDFTLPELGEGVTTGDVLRVLVKPGDTVAKDQPVLELETDKATVEVPSSVAGVVKEIKVKVGDKVTVGQAILSVEDAGAQAVKEPVAEKAGPKPAAKPASKSGAKVAEEEKAPDRTSATARAPEKAAGAPEKTAGAPEKAKPQAKGKAEGKEEPEEEAEPEENEEPEEPEAPAPKARRGEVVDISRGARPLVEPPAAPKMPPTPAGPSVRRLARELGVDINEVPVSGPSDRISVEDVKARAKQLVAGVTRAGSVAAEPLPDFSRWGEVERQPMRAVRRKTAQHVSAAWTTIPHVTQFDLADITGLEELRHRFAKQAEEAGGNLTVTSIAVKVVAAALKVFPQFNASIDMASEEIIFKKYVNIGVAVDTDRGLLVPVIRDADTKNIEQLSVELSQLADKARTRKLTLDEMQGGCFTITNLGGIGGTAFTPIVNSPEVAILGISRASMQPVFKRPRSATPGNDDGGFVPRLMLPLSLAYDHRVIDGADGIRFLRWVAEALKQPFLLALQG